MTGEKSRNFRRGWRGRDGQGEMVRRKWDMEDEEMGRRGWDGGGGMERDDEEMVEGNKIGWERDKGDEMEEKGIR